MKWSHLSNVLLVAVSVWSQTSAAEVSSSQLSPRPQIAELLSSGSACELYDLSSKGALFELGRADQVLSSDWLDLVAEVTKQGIPRPRAKAEKAQYHRPLHPVHERYFWAWPKNETFRRHVMKLSQALRSNPSLRIKLGDVLAEADRRIETAKANGEIGECYKISQVTGTFNSEWIQTVALSAKAQEAIDQLFSQTLSERDLSPRELEILRSGALTLAEMAELRAVRAATRIFEQNTVLAHDQGGFGGNMDFNGRVRSVCRTEAQTYYFFLKRLQDRGLLTHFRPSETWAYRKRRFALDGHAASLLESQRTQDLFVVDSWHEQGGTAAHITFFTDWIKALDRADVVSSE